jgi:serine/threonine protein phosphatase PrpC
MTAAASSFAVTTLTDPGCVREINEDRICSVPAVGLWAVADGMGGHSRGDWAADVVSSTLAQIRSNDDFGHQFYDVRQAIERANLRIRAEAAVQGASMGATVAALLLSSDRFAVAWAGDSRAYLWRQGELHRLTRDHSQVQEMVDRGLLSEDQARDHPMSHVLSRAVGAADAIHVDIVGDEVAPGDIYILSTDGIHGVVSDSEIVEALASRGAQAGRVLETWVRERGAPDNYSLILIEVPGVAT